MHIILLILVLLLTSYDVNADWQKIDISSLAWLRAAYFLNSNHGFIVGSHGTLLETKDGGKTWRQRPKFTTDNILDVYFSDEKTGWLLCEKSSITLPGELNSYFLKTSDGGTTWQKIELMNERRRFTRFFATKSGIFVVGEAGALYFLSNNEQKRVNVPIPYRLTSGFAVNESIFITGGNGSLLLFNQSTNTWDYPSLIEPSKNRLNAIFFINKQRGWLVGNEGKIYTTFNGGKTWYQQNSGTNKNLNDVFFKNSMEGFVVGDDGLILQTNDGGNSWFEVKGMIPHKLERIIFQGDVGFAVGFGGTILRYQ